MIDKGRAEQWMREISGDPRPFLESAHPERWPSDITAALAEAVEAFRGPPVSGEIRPAWVVIAFMALQLVEMEFPGEGSKPERIARAMEQLSFVISAESMRRIGILDVEWPDDWWNDEFLARMADPGALN